MLRSDKYRKFKELHVPGNALVLYNIWDAGGAKAVAEAGAKAIATSSWSVAAAHGFSDGEEMPLDFVLMLSSGSRKVPTCRSLSISKEVMLRTPYRSPPTSGA